ncbi:hypothetical protein Q3G72_030263 [Acer saccharum]|nr:hypothetical protein Q3G72_030263 [Acer saccharum]
MSSNRSPFPKTVGQKGAGIVGVAEKGKERWVRNLKLKPARFPSLKGGIRIGVGRKEQLSQSIEESSSSGKDIGRGVIKRGCGETSLFNGLLSPKEGGLIKEGFLKKEFKSIRPLYNEGLRSPMGIRAYGPSQVRVKSSVNIEIEEGDLSSSAEVSEPEEGKKESQRVRVMNSQEREIMKGINLCIDLRDQISSSSSQFTGGSVSPIDMGGSQDTVVGETIMEESGGKRLTGHTKDGGKGSESYRKRGGSWYGTQSKKAEDIGRY